MGQTISNSMESVDVDGDEYRPMRAPRVLIANANLVGHWSSWEKFRELDRLGLIMYGQMTAGSWIYMGTQRILQGTFETFAAATQKYFRGDLAGKLVVTGGLGRLTPGP